MNDDSNNNDSDKTQRLDLNDIDIGRKDVSPDATQQIDLAKTIPGGEASDATIRIDLGKTVDNAGAAESGDATRMIPAVPTSLPEETAQPAQKVSGEIPAAESFTNTTILPRIEGEPPAVKFVVDAQRRFEHQKKLGEGGAGEVELVLDKDIYRLVAVKRLKKNLQNTMMLMRFVDEIRTVGHLEHPNIVPIHDVGLDENGQYYFVMKYVIGETLHSVIEKLKQGNPDYHKKYTFQYRVGIFTEILKAVEFAHHNGVIHRDIKPANIMVGPHGEVTVMDWGITKRLKGYAAKEPDNKLLDQFEAQLRETEEKLPEEQRMTVTMNNTTIGTPAYMAPEQVSGKSDEHDVRTDIYSLNALFYEFLTLRSYLTPKKTLEELLKGVLHEKPKLAMLVRNKFQPAVPADLTHFLTKGLQKNPADRFQTVKEMQTLLQRINEGYAPVQCPFTLTKRAVNIVVHLVNDHPMLGLFFFMFLTLMGMAGVWFLVRLFFLT
jgi:serine/threonine-protein kinase